MPTITIDGIPVYEALVDGDGLGMLRISLVDDPAVMSDFQAFDAQRRILTYRIEDEDKRLVRGVVMRADFPIYRRDNNGYEYYIIYRANTIRDMAQKYLAEGRQNAVDLMHDGNEVAGVEMVQYFIKDAAAGITPEGFDDIADGSLFAEFHITDDDIWTKVKDGTYRGFSLEGIFDLQPVPESGEDYIDRVVRDLGDAFSRFYRKITDMSKLQRIKARLAKLLEAFGNVTTDRGVLAWDGDEDLKVGDSVYIENQDGEREAAADGDYKTADGKTIVVVDGKVAEIKDPEAEVGDDPDNADNFQSVSTDGGDLEWDGDEDLREGDAVYTRNTEGEREPAADGTYTTQDGKTITVADGKVTSIEDNNSQVASDDEAREEFSRRRQKYEESYDEKYRRIAEAVMAVYSGNFYIVEAGDDFAVIDTWSGDYTDHYYRYSVSWAEDGSATVADPVEVKSMFVPLDFVSPFDEAGNETEDLRRQLAEANAEVERLRKKPAARPAHEEYEGQTVVRKTGIKGLDRLAQLMSK